MAYSFLIILFLKIQPLPQWHDTGVGLLYAENRSGISQITVVAGAIIIPIFCRKIKGSGSPALPHDDLCRDFPDILEIDSLPAIRINEIMSCHRIFMPLGQLFAS